jgi:hypothetical protein
MSGLANFQDEFRNSAMHMQRSDPQTAHADVDVLNARSPSRPTTQRLSLVVLLLIPQLVVDDRLDVGRGRALGGTDAVHGPRLFEIHR